MGQSKERVARLVGEAFEAAAAKKKDAWVSEPSERFEGARVYVDVAAPAVRAKARLELDSGNLLLRGESVEWRAADPREGPPLGKGEWNIDYE